MIISFYKDCPLCGRSYTGPDEIGMDGHTHMCKVCKAVEALTYLGIEEDERNRMIERMRKEGEFDGRGYQEGRFW